MTKSNHYINNADFLKALIDYKESCDLAKKEKKEDPIIPNYIGECFYKIADHLSRKPNFISYSFRDEMIADGIENCLMYFRNFDPAKSKNPFAYFTQIIYYAFLRRISKEEKHRYIMYKNFQETMTQIYEMNNNDDGLLIPSSMYDNINVFMKKFEKKEEEKKVKRKEVKIGLQKFYDEKELDK